MIFTNQFILIFSVPVVRNVALFSFLSTIMNYALSQQHLCFMFGGFEFKNLELAVGIDRQSERLNYETDLYLVFEFTN